MLKKIAENEMDLKMAENVNEMDLIMAENKDEIWKKNWLKL